MTEDEAREIVSQLLGERRIVFLNEGDGTVSLSCDVWSVRELEAVLIGLKRSSHLLHVDPTQFIGGIK